MHLGSNEGDPSDPKRSPEDVGAKFRAIDIERSEESQSDYHQSTRFAISAPLLVRMRLKRLRIQRSLAQRELFCFRTDRQFSSNLVGLHPAGKRDLEPTKPVKKERPSDYFQVRGL